MPLLVYFLRIFAEITKIIILANIPKKYADSGVDYAEKRLIKITPGFNDFVPLSVKEQEPNLRHLDFHFSVF
jgi:hypothetical protein